VRGRECGKRDLCGADEVVVGNLGDVAHIVDTDLHKGVARRDATLRRRASAGIDIREAQRLAAAALVRGHRIVTLGSGSRKTDGPAGAGEIELDTSEGRRFNGLGDGRVTGVSVVATRGAQPEHHERVARARHALPRQVCTRDRQCQR
jgi:hypothetical protein